MWKNNHFVESKRSFSHERENECHWYHVLNYLPCLWQLLRAMFGINALSQPELIQNALVPPCLAESHVTVPEQPDQLKAPDESLYHSCFIQPLTFITKTLEKLKPKEEVKEKGNESDSLGYIYWVLIIHSTRHHFIELFHCHNQHDYHLVMVVLIDMVMFVTVILTVWVTVVTFYKCFPM